MKKIMSIPLLIGVFFFLIFSAGPETGKDRDYLTTGNWYPRDAAGLGRMMEKFFGGEETEKVPGKILGLVAPHAGLVYSGKCAAAAYRQLRDAPDIERVFLLGVSHGGGFYGACVSDFATNSTPLGKVELDREITSKLAKEKHFRVDNRIMQYEHSLENQLPFLQWILRRRSVKFVPILFGALNKEDYDHMARAIGRYVKPGTILVASSDLTHYGRNFGYLPFKDNLKSRLNDLDMGIIRLIQKTDFEEYFRYKRRTGITMCGFTPVGVLMKILSRRKAAGRLMSYYKSGDLNGDYSHSVSYASIVFSAAAGKTSTQSKESEDFSLSQTEKKTLLRLARYTLSEYFKRKEVPSDAVVRRELGLTGHCMETRGVFVTLKKNKILRGCIGSLVGQLPLYKDVMRNALKAAFQDPRFPPLEQPELNNVEIEISVMTPLKEIADYQKIRLGVDGVIIRNGLHQAVYLPQVAVETGWGLDRFLGNLSRKAGMAYDGYKDEKSRFYIFQALVFHEEPPGSGRKK